MAEHKHGSMNIEAQEKTFNSFIKLTKNITIGIIVALILLYMING
ncbi:MAG: aa3-type cytochrome c oxidase subunit IV [Dinoroseobacter sp.]|nr:aa3-type cytochrome c oxidase subunit IV [Dinoroseobacter sp.]